jgi:DNA (cytosine-5)-methyltransferase 1
VYQFDMFDYIEREKWGLPLRVCELYGGIGSQRKALKNLGIKTKEHYLVEVDIDATISYASIHCNLNKYLDNNVPSKEDMITYLSPFGFRSQEKLANLSRISNDKLKKLYLSTKLSKNLGDVSKLNDLPAVDLITWSTPCQDFSIAGGQNGFDGDKGGLTFITLNLFKKLSYKPTFLLFENVPAITSKKFIDGFNKMMKELETIGYNNHVMTLNAKNFGIPQNRKRVYVLSVRKDYALDYQQPKPFTLTKRLKDFLDEEVDKKFYLTDKQLELLQKINFDSMGLSRVNDENGICNTITTMGGGHREPKVARTPSSIEYSGFKSISPTLKARDYKDPNWILDNTKIRKITPLESWRLMGFDDEDYNKASLHLSNSALYKQAGNSIVVQVLEAIFNNIFIGEEK